jgi:metal-dependent amidase/aminoacylase/carboxypeptidase family protein
MQIGVIAEFADRLPHRELRRRIHSHPELGAAVTVGEIMAGEAMKVIPEHATLRGTVRCLEPALGPALRRRFEALVGGGADGCMIHNPRYDFNDAIIPAGASYWLRLVETALPA